MGRYSPNADWVAHHPEAPALSLIVAVDKVDEATRRSLDDMLKVIGDSPCEVIVALQEMWPDARPEVTVVSWISASRGVRFDGAASRARGRILAFLDTDICLPGGWPERVIKFFDDPDVAMAEVPVLLRARSRGERVSALILNGHLGTTPSRSLSPSDQSGIVSQRVDSNVLIRSDVFRRVGGFRTRQVGGETIWLCHRVRELVGCTFHYQPDLAVIATARPFPGPFLTDIASYGNARGNTARGFVMATVRRFRGSRLVAHGATHDRAGGDMPGGFRQDVAASFFPYSLPALMTLLVILEAILVLLSPIRHLRLAEFVGGTVLLAIVMIQVGRVAFARGPARISDRALAALGSPLVSVTFGLAFVRGFFDTR